jgi:hypothetical protein
MPFTTACLTATRRIRHPAFSSRRQVLWPTDSTTLEIRDESIHAPQQRQHVDIKPWERIVSAVEWACLGLSSRRNSTLSGVEHEDQDGHPFRASVRHA